MWSCLKDQLLAILCVVLFSFMCAACDSYSEGDELANKAFEKMTEQEKTYYSKVQDAWGEKYLTFIRAAIRKRMYKPDESSIPFGDIPKLIVSTNDVTMTIEESWTGDTRKRRGANKFSEIDGRWYDKIRTLATGGEKEDSWKKQSYKPAKQEPPPVSEPMYVDSFVVSSPPPRVEEFEEGVQYDMDDLLPDDEYLDLKLQISKCPLAKAYLSKVVRSGRPITLKDRDVMVEKALYCKSVALNNSFAE